MYFRVSANSGTALDLLQAWSCRTYVGTGLDPFQRRPTFLDLFMQLLIFAISSSVFFSKKKNRIKKKHVSVHRTLTRLYCILRVWKCVPVKSKQTNLFLALKQNRSRSSTQSFSMWTGVRFSLSLYLALLCMLQIFRLDCAFPESACFLAAREFTILDCSRLCNRCGLEPGSGRAQLSAQVGGLLWARSVSVAPAFWEGCVRVVFMSDCCPVLPADSLCFHATACIGRLGADLKAHVTCSPPDRRDGWKPSWNGTRENEGLYTRLKAKEQYTFGILMVGKTC